MLNFDIKKKINSLRDILVGKVPDPKAQVEQITIALIYKFMDDMDIEGMRFGATREFFKGEYEKYAWTNLMQSENSGLQRAILYSEGIDKMSTNPHLPQLFRDIFRGAYVPYRDPETLNMFLKEINDFTYDHSEELGNAFEYLLSIMGSQGDAGQFRTPRHIIDMMVEIIDPKKTDSILDPACGTAGFLISSYKHILKNNKDENRNSTLSAEDRKRMTENFVGYDISPDMVRLSRVNMYLHKFAKPKIHEYDTLTSLERWDESFDVILANPPFMSPKGGIIPHNRYRVNAKRSEVLFVDYMAEHLNPTGKAGIIVPEGIVFQSGNAYKALRKYLVEDGILFAVISLPAGVFNPYSGVKTSILLFDKTIAKQKDEILFVKINNDGFDLGAQRRELGTSDIPKVIDILKDYIAGKDVSDDPLVTIAKKADIAKQDYILVGDRYKVAEGLSDSNYDWVQLSELCVEILDGDWIESKDQSEEGIRLIQTGNIGIGEFKDKSDKARFIDDKTFSRLSCTEIFPGDVLVSRLPDPVGRACTIPNTGTKMITAVDCAILRFNNNLIIPKLFVFYTKSEAYYHALEPYLTGSSRRRISRSNLGLVKIPLPPLHIQEEIVKEIEGYQKIIDGARQVVDNYKPTIKIDPSWEIAKLGEVCSYDRIMAGEEHLNLPYIGMEDVESNTGVISTKAIDGTNVIGAAGAYLFSSRHVLYGRLRPYLNKVATPDFEGRCSTELIPILVSEVLDKEFLSIILRSKNSVDYAMSTNTGARMPRTDLNEFLKLPIPVPSKSSQLEILQEIKNEISIINDNKRLIEIFEKKIKDKIAEVWGGQ